MPASGSVFGAQEIHNDRYRLVVGDHGTVSIEAPGLPTPKRLAPEFTVIISDQDPQCTRDASHPNYPVAPRTAVRWRNPDEPLDRLNAWISSPAIRVRPPAWSGAVQDTGKTRVWEYRDASNQVKLRVTGGRAFDTTHPIFPRPA